MDLRVIIEEHWSNSLFMSLVSNKEMRQRIIEETAFLDKYYENIQLRSRAYCVKNGITQENLPQCKCNCGRPAGLDNGRAIKGFRIYCGPDCHHRDHKINEDALSKLKDYDWVYQERIVKKKSIEKIAEELSVSTIPVVKWLKIHKLKDVIKNVRELLDEELELLQNKEFLYDLYVTKNYTIRQISNEYKMGIAAISEWLKKHEIPIKNSNEYPRRKNFGSNSEKQVIKYIKRLINNDLVVNDRRVLKGKEIDILIPELNLGIEYNGIYSHVFRPNEEKEGLRKDKNYHLFKTIKCLEKGIQLIQLFSSEWDNNRIVAKGFIKRKLLKNKRINANNCIIKKISPNRANRFLKSNCLEGVIYGGFESIGLFYNNKLIQLFCYVGNEIIRTSTKIGISVVGGFKSLLDDFKKTNERIYFYVNRRFSNGRLLTSLGFFIDEVIEPRYYYTNKSYGELFDADVIEEKCLGNEDYCFYCVKPQYKKIFDCGLIKFKLQ